MHRFELCDIVGGTANGTLMKAKNKESGEMRIIEEVKRTSDSWTDCISLREIRVMRELQHENIVGLREIIREANSMYLVFDYFESSLQEWWNIKRCSEQSVCTVIIQLALALAHCHSKGIAHKNLSPECIFLNNKGFLKLAHFTHAEFVSDKPAQTSQEATINKWYRPPEYFLKIPTNPLKADLWALGCIIAELFLLRPLIPGVSETDQLERITNLLGQQYSMKSSIFKNPSMQRNSPSIIKILEDIPSEAFNLIMGLLQVDPENRMNLKEVLNHPFLKEAKIPQFNVFQPQEVILRQLQEKLKEEYEQFQKSLTQSPSKMSVDDNTPKSISSPGHHKKTNSCCQSPNSIKGSSPSSRGNSPQVNKSSLFASKSQHSPNLSFSSFANKGGLLIDSLQLDSTNNHNNNNSKTMKRSSMPSPSSSPSKDYFIK